MKKILWKALLAVTLLAIVAGCAPTAAPAGGSGAAAAPTAVQSGVIQLSTGESPQGADWMMVASEANPKKGGTLTTAWGMSPTHFDIHQGGGCAGCGMMYNGLIMWNVADGYHTIVPALATEWTESDDGLTYTFKLREGVKFQDGSDFDAKDVLATFNRILNPPSNISISGIKEQLSMVKSVASPDDLTVVFTLSQVTPFFLEVLAGDSMIIYSAEELATNNNDLRGVTVPTGTGPFKFVEYIQGEKLTMEANPNYWNKNLPYVDKVVMLHVPAWPDRGTAVLTGQADFTFNGSYDTWIEAQKRDNMVTAHAPCLNSHMFAINNTLPPFDNPKVRKAINLAVDRQAVIDAFTPVWEPAFVSRWLPAASPWAMPYEDVLKTPGYRPDKTEDIAAAKKLMEEAGYPDGFKTTFTAWTEASSSEVAVPAFAETLRKALNITGDVKAVERARTTDILSAGDFSLFKADIYASPVLDPLPLWNLYIRTGASQNFSKYSNPDFDKLLDELAVTVDPKARQDLINKGMDMLDDNPPFILIGFCAHSVIANKAVKGLDITNRAWSKFDRFETAWLDR